VIVEIAGEEERGRDESGDHQALVSSHIVALDVVMTDEEEDGAGAVEEGVDGWEERECVGHSSCSPPFAALRVGHP
jgi:hypothetical protein